jgi:hypothetical protein
MDKAVAQLNIEHYRKLLSAEMDPTKRATLEGCSPKKRRSWRR